MLFNKTRQYNICILYCFVLLTVVQKLIKENILIKYGTNLMIDKLMYNI